MDLRQTVCCHVSSDGFLLRIPLDWGRVAQGGPGAGWGNQKSLRRYHSFNHASNAPINVDRGNVKVAGQFRISNSDNTSKKLRKVDKPIFFQVWQVGEDEKKVKGDEGSDLVFYSLNQLWTNTSYQINIQVLCPHFVKAQSQYSLWLDNHKAWSLLWSQFDEILKYEIVTTEPCFESDNLIL